MSAQTKAIFTPRAIVLLVLLVFVPPLIPMIISGQWDWWEAWVYAIGSGLIFIVSRILAGRRHPDLLSERARYMEAKDTKSWDKILAPLVGVGSILVYVAAGLDRYYGGSPGFSLGVKLIALAVLLFGYIFSSAAVVENRFFAGTVRIQTERGHQVVSSGPYRFVRHPGYAGAVWGYLGVPIWLDSSWAFVPALLLIGVLILRTALEDKTLQDELPGYKEFTRETRYRLIPGIW
ncbi:MAG: isoprenylcysteine carboxylmethyltransferase family protein [Anaerolineales bacterium]|nr:isoprenylcysteine carboxylmethyltransferase family protein [Anaerolineales bacterium]